LLLGKATMPESWGTARWLGISIVGAMLAFAAFRKDRSDIGRFLLVVAGIGALLFGLLPLTDDILRTRELVTRVPYLFAASSLVGTVVLGAASVSAFFSLWVWVMGGPIRQDLLRLVKLTIGAVGVRCVLLLAMLVGLSRLDPRFTASYFPTLWAENIGLFGVRVAAGMALPLWFCTLALRNLHQNADSRTMYWLIAATVSAFIGEMLAGFLLV
jgi:hypothetical protein